MVVYTPGLVVPTSLHANPLVPSLLARARARNQSNVACIHLSLSNDAAPLITWVKLPGEITVSNLGRATGVATMLNATAYSVTYTWTASAAADVQCTGLHWSATGDSSDNLIAAASISSVSLQANDMLQVTWTVNIPDG